MSDCPHIELIQTPPRQNTRIYKDECSCCMRSAKEPDGIYICLHCFSGFCPDHFPNHFAKTKHTLYLKYHLRLSADNGDQGFVVNDAGEISQGHSTALTEQYIPETSANCYDCAKYCGLEEFPIDTSSSPVCNVTLSLLYPLV